MTSISQQTHLSSQAKADAHITSKPILQQAHKWQSLGKWQR